MPPSTFDFPVSTSIEQHTLAATFADLRARGRVGLMPFIAAGYPNLQTTVELLPAIERSGASAIEIGIPFSDPIADGPVIQEAFTAALAKKIKVADVFKAVAEARAKVKLPLVAMVSYSIAFRFGGQRFFHDAREAGFNGLILPDLPPPEAQKVCAQVRAAGLDTVLLVAPTTSPKRRKEIVDLCSGFIYYLSISGITGERDKLPADLAANLRQLKQLTDTPICVGFGLSKAEHLKQLTGLADGAIVGSAIVRHIKAMEGKHPTAIADEVETYCRELLS